MVSLNDYLYSGDTVLRILHNYIKDLRKDAKMTGNEIDMIHCNFLLQIQELLEHNDFLTAQSQKMREFYKYMAQEYPFMAFTFKGRIKAISRCTTIPYICTATSSGYQVRMVFLSHPIRRSVKIPYL